MIVIKRLSAVLTAIFICLMPCFLYAINTTYPCNQVLSECSVEDWLETSSSITMCFQKLDVSCDNGLVWTKIFDARKIGGIEINLIDLDKNVDLSKVKGLRFGTLKKNTSYSCARAEVSSVIITPLNGVPCNATNLIEEEGINISTMYIRGTDACPGGFNYPTFIPLQTTDASSVDLRFNGEISADGFPKFTLKTINVDELETNSLTDAELFSPPEFETEEMNQ